MTDTDAPISVNLSGTRTGDEAEWAFNAAQSWLRRDEPQVGQRYTYREGGWIVSLQRKPLTIIARTYAAVNALPELLAKVKRLEAQCKALSYVHEGAVTQAREYLQEQLGVTIDPIDMSDAIGAYLEVVTRAALNQETKP